MDRQNQRKITKNLVTVKKALRRDIEGITERLTEEGIFSKQTGEEIGTTDPLMKSGVFISKLLRSDTRAYWCFRDVLEELGYQKLVLSMEKSGTAGPGTGNKWNVDKEKTFVLPPPQIPSIVNTDATITRDSDIRTATDKNETDVVELLRMATFVMNTAKSNNNRNSTILKELKTNKMENSDSETTDELINTVTSMGCTSFSC